MYGDGDGDAVILSGRRSGEIETLVVVMSLHVDKLYWLWWWKEWNLVVRDCVNVIYLVDVALSGGGGGYVI